MNMNRHARFWGLLTIVLAASIVGRASATLLLYEPFNYTAGANLGGVDPDPDPLGAPGTPIGLTNTSTGGGTWYARGTASNYQSNNDAVVSSGNLSYSGLAASQGSSVSYGSSVGSSIPLVSDTIDLPGDPITTGSLYASFIIFASQDGKLFSRITATMRFTHRVLLPTFALARCLDS